MALVITLAHQKGGVGKTTLTLNLYEYFRALDLQCAIVDSDAQGSIVRLYQTLGQEDDRGDINIITVEDVDDYQYLSDHDEYDVILIDTPPYLSNHLPRIFDASDMVIVPTKASPLDVDAIQGTIVLVKEAMQRRPHLKSGIVLTMVIQGTDFTDIIREDLESRDLHVFTTSIGNRVSYARSLILGPSVHSENNSKAQDEIGSLGQEIIDMLDAE